MSLCVCWIWNDELMFTLGGEMKREHLVFPRLCLCLQPPRLTTATWLLWWDSHWCNIAPLPSPGARTRPNFSLSCFGSWYYSCYGRGVTRTSFFVCFPAPDHVSCDFVSAIKYISTIYSTSYARVTVNHLNSHVLMYSLLFLTPFRPAPPLCTCLTLQWPAHATTGGPPSSIPPSL